MFDDKSNMQDIKINPIFFWLEQKQRGAVALVLKASYILLSLHQRIAIPLRQVIKQELTSYI